MARRLVRRGPDGEGYWFEPRRGVALGHRRLAILDLSSNGHQPMVSVSGRYVIVFNGEIYNFRELKVEIDAAQPGFQWRGHSDTEVLLAAIERWGLARTLRRIRGMFAFALWDRRDSLLTLARDRFGEKPLHYGTVGGAFAFASQACALAALPGWTGEIEPAATAAYARYNYVPGPLSIYRQVLKLPPASTLTVRLSNSGDYSLGRVEPYWSAVDAAGAARERPFEDAGDARCTVEAALSESVRERLESDVPLGAFLSGGVDSTVVVALMQRYARGPVHTYTIAVDDARINEAPFAAAVARHLGTRHTEHHVSPAETIDVAQDIAHYFDEPFADSSQIPTFLIARAARREVTVALTGDGGDEIFGGYNRYFVGQATWRRARRLPRALRAVAAAGLRALSPATWDALIRGATGILGTRRTLGISGDRIHKLALVLDAQGPQAMYGALLANSAADWASGDASDPVHELVSDPASWREGWSVAECMMLMDTLAVLPDDFLVKVDRAAMGVSLETRTPFLDAAVFDVAWRLPDSMRFTATQGKRLLREIAYQYVPQNLLDRPKQGFGVPLDAWLRGPLHEWARERLESQAADERDYPALPAALEAWREHQHGRRNHQDRLWNALMFLEWRRAQAARFVDRSPAPETRLVACA